MTEYSKIPPFSGESTRGKSLFERASEEMKLGGFKPAPVPKDLAPPPSRRLRPKQPQESKPETVTAPIPEIAEPSLPAAVERPEPRTKAAQFRPDAEPRPNAPVQPIAFRGACHPVDRAHLREQGLIQPEGPVTALLEEFRIVKRKLLKAARKAPQGTAALASPQRVLVCSPHTGEGKTFCSVNLALAMAAERDSEVVLVDADFAKPSILSTLGLPGGPGLMDALADPTIRVEDCVLGTDIEGLWVLPAGNQTNADSEYLASGATRDVLDRLTRGAPHRMVIFDSPPALAATPAAELAKYAGQALLVARADTTGQNALEDAITLLSDCPDIKLLLNAALFSPSGRRFGAYYGYGE